MSDFIKKSITIHDEFVPPLHTELLYLDHQLVLSKGYMMGIVAASGIGKSQMCEYFASVWITPELSKHIQFTTHKQSCLYIDTERSLNDCYNGLQRIKGRCGLSITPSTFHFESFESVYNIEEYLIHLEYLIQQYQDIALVILDGMNDFISDINNNNESSELFKSLNTIAKKYNVGILYTIHSNRDDDSGKGNGHLGRILQIKSSAFFKLSNDPKNVDIKYLSSKFKHNKIRNGSSKTPIHLSFIWNNTLNR